jgi:hypothetical protein
MTDNVPGTGADGLFGGGGTGTGCGRGAGLVEPYFEKSGAL